MMLAALIRGVAAPVYRRLTLEHLDYVTGLENIPREGPLVVVANHSSYADHFALLTLLHAVRPGEVWFPTKSESFERFGSRIWHESMRCFPVHRDAPGEQVFIRANEVLGAGQVLALYPEGTRGTGDELLPFKSGAFRMALAANAPVVPVGLANLSRVLPKGSRRLTHAVAGVAVGPPLRQAPGENREASRAMRDEARSVIQTLIDQAEQPTSEARTRAVADITNLSDRVVLENLDNNGLISPEVINRLELLHDIGRAIARRNEEPLAIRQTRLQGFRALSSSFDTVISLRAGLVNRRATRLAQRNPHDGLAVYLAGRSQLLAPTWAGGDPSMAQVFFEQARADARLASKAGVGLGEALVRVGHLSQARTAWREAQVAIPADDPRGPARRARIQFLIDQIGGTD